MDYEPSFCNPGNFSESPSSSVGSTERFRNMPNDPRGSGYYGNPWYASDQPGNAHHAWEDNTRFYELQAQRVGKGPLPPKLRREEQNKLAQLNIPKSYLDYYPLGVYTKPLGYGDRVEKYMGQPPWDLEPNAWYAENYSDTIDYGTYDSKRYMPVYRAEAEARTQELQALYNNGHPRNWGIETFATAIEYSVVPPGCVGACAERYRRLAAKTRSKAPTQERFTTAAPIPDRQLSDTNVLFLPGTAEVWDDSGSIAQNPIPYRGNLPKGVQYPEWTGFTQYGCTTLDCRQ